MDFFNRRKKYLVDSLRKQSVAWDSPYNKPSYPKLAQAIKTAQEEIERLSAYDESYTPSFVKAKESLDSAWSNRDDRDHAISAIKSAYTYLSKNDSVAETGLNKHQRESRQELYGAVAYNSSDIRDIAVIENIKKTVKAISMRGDAHPKMYDSIKSQVYNIAIQYPEDSAIHDAAHDVFYAIDSTVRMRGKNSYKSYNDSIVNSLDVLAQTIDHENRPDGYVPNMNNRDVYSIKSAVEDLLDDMYSYTVASPCEVLPAAMQKAKRIKAQLLSFGQSKELRLIDECLSRIGEMNQNSHAVKSLDIAGWNHGNIRSHLDIVLQKLSDLNNMF